MPFAIEMNVDAKSDAAVRRIWDALKERGLGSTWMETARPHVSLAVAGSVAPGIGQRLEAFARSMNPMAFEWRSVGTFPSGVVYLDGVVTREMLEVHARFHEEFALAPAAISHLYAPDAWVPHCTLASPVPRERMAEAIEVALAHVEPPIVGRYEQLSLVEFPSPRERGCWPIGGGQ